MRKISYVGLFIGLHVLFVFLQIHKTSYITKCSYKKQKNEHERELLVQKKQTLMHQLHALRNPPVIKDFVDTHLTMKPVKLSQIRTLNADH